MKFLEKFWFGCAHCHTGEGCPVADAVDPDTGELSLRFGGMPLVPTVILVFLLPLMTAIVGASLAGRWVVEGTSEYVFTLCQLGGAIVGFFVGVGLARVTFWIRRRFVSADGGAEE